MKALLKVFCSLIAVAFVFDASDSFAAAKTAKKQSAIQGGTKVRTKTEASGLYDQECYDKYYSCMDQFCIMDNEDGGSCACSDDSIALQEEVQKIKGMLSDAERIKMEEVEKVKAGANADIVFDGSRSYDKNGNVVQTKATKDKEELKKSMWSSIYDEENDEDLTEMDEDMDIFSQKGAALYDSANKLCKQQMDESCSKDLTLLVKMYSRQIVSDCKGFANSVEVKKQEAKSELASANSEVRNALKESLAESNKYNRGECMVEYKKCMMGQDACGKDWENCVFTIAGENMQNKAAVSTKGTKVKTVKTYDITASTMEILESKRFICERVLDSCVTVRDYVWDDFLREAAPTIRLAESNIESKKRQSCLGDISDCIQKACKDDIEGKGVASMDACLARPDMARSFCKVQIDPCERMEPQIWEYVVSKLAAMRVDACTEEVKECFTADDRCGQNFQNCIGMDYEYIHDICPIDKLVVCKQAKKNFKMEDLDEMLMGLYLNIDNKALENCKNLAEKKMMELCGSTTDCNTFASDEFIGTSSIKPQKDGNIYRVTGMISFGSIKMGDAAGNVKDGGRVLAPGEIGVADYIEQVKKTNQNVPNAETIITSIEEELNNIAGTINRAISLIESDQEVQYCITGRDLSQINGKGSGKDNTTKARFPKLLNQYRVAIGMAALRKAQDNYNEKWQGEISKAIKDSSADVAQYMCQMLPTGTGSIGLSENDKPLTPPYAISYEVATGVTLAQLTKGGYSSQQLAGAKMDATNVNVGALAGAGVKVDIPGGTKTQRATFNRETRVCHLCTEFVTRACKQKGGSFLGLGIGFDNRKLECGEEKRTEDCDDIPM